MGKLEKKARKQATLKMVALAAVLVVVIAVLAFTLIGLRQLPVTTTTTSAPTTVPIVILKISSCTAISSPGTYYLTGSISTGIQSGPCITVSSSNVRIIGNGNGVMGSGPYVATPPYTYGILIGNVTNVTVTGVVVSKFSYDIYLNGTRLSYLTNSSSKNATISGIYLYNASSDYLAYDNSSGASSSSGGVVLQGGGNNTFANDIVQDNAYYGLVVNSTQNLFSHDSFISNPIDLSCQGTTGFKSKNNFSDSHCSVSDYCSFAQCSQTNLQYNFSSVVLPHSISACGAISSSGTYSLASDVNLSQYINVSGLYPGQSVCIDIQAPNVKLDCNGHTISNAGYGVYATSVSGLYNISVNDCTFNADSYGISLTHVFQANITGIAARDGVFGIYLQNVTTGSVANVSASKDTYGIALNNTSGITFSNINASDNTYGAFVETPTPNIYISDIFENNTDGDLSCTSSSYNSTLQTVQNTRCGVSSCAWGTCSVYHLLSQFTYQLSGCSPITKPGNYSLASSVVTFSNTCFTIDSRYVNLNCDGHAIIGNSEQTAVNDTGQSNVTLSNCRIENFGTGVAFSNANGLGISNTNITYANIPLLLENSSYDTVSNVTSVYSQAVGFVFNNVKHSSIINDTSAYGLSPSPGFNFSNSSQDVIVYDTAKLNPGYGFSFSSSRNNKVSNNTGDSNKVADYYCSPDSSGLYAETGGINTGLDKVGCKWLVALPTTTIAMPCEGIDTSTPITLTQDMLYTYNTTCYSIYNNIPGSANNTVIDCNGHTVFATHGGTFADVVNSSGVTVEDCVLKNFTTPIISSSPSTEILNNTIGTAKAGITLSGGQFQSVLNNTIENASYGIFVQGSKFAAVKKNNLTNANISIDMVGDSFSVVSNNTASEDAIGLYMTNSSGDSVSYNHFVASRTDGVACALAAQNTTSENHDLGGNICYSNLNCNWMTVSPQCRV